MLGDWRWWAVSALLLTTTYVQIVGKHIEMISGLDRVENLHTAYRYLFGRAPWVQWPMFRWSGFIQIGGLVAVLYLWGWLATALTFILTIGFGLIVWAPARGHATEMIEQIRKLQ